MWQGSRVRADGKFALLGTTMSPGFEYEDYETGTRQTLSAQFPQYSGDGGGVDTLGRAADAGELAAGARGGILG